MRLHCPRYSRVLVLAVVSFIPVHLTAAEEPDADAEKAEAVLRQLLEHFQKLRTFSVEMSMSMRMEGPGVKHHYDTKHRLSVKKPDKLALISTGGVLGRTIIYDGEQAYSENPLTGESATNTPRREGGLDNLLLNYLAPAMPQEEHALRVIRALISNDPYAKWMRQVSGSLAYLGTEEVDGRECHKLKRTLSGKGGWYLFIDASESPLLREVRPDTSEASQEMCNMKMDLSIMFTDWKLDVDLPDERFQIPPRKTEGKGAD
jgi:hypothetical protein